MKSFSRLTAWLFLSGVLCFAPSAFGLESNRHQAAGVNGILSAPPSFLAFTLLPSHRHRVAEHDGGGEGGGNGCGNQAKGGGWGWGSDEGGGNGNGGGCTPVPEGGTALAYLTIAGLCCLGAVVMRSRRQVRVSQAS